MRVLALICALFPFNAAADETAEIVTDVVQEHILPGFDRLSAETEVLQATAASDCVATSTDLRAAYHKAFDAWISVSHLRFGPSEVEDRAFALAFWPDSRGATPRVLTALISDEDAIAESVDEFADVSIAGRGFYALEFLLYDDAIQALGHDAYQCLLIQTITADIAAVSQAILSDWETKYADRIMAPSPDGRYRSEDEAVQELFKALTTGLEFTSETRLGRPLGTFDRPRPTRAEAYRSGRSLRNVQVSLLALEDIALRLARSDPSLVARLEAGFDRTTTRAAELDDPVFAGVSNPQSRLQVEALKQMLDGVRAIVRDELGPTLGVAAGFNSLDGD